MVIIAVCYKLEVFSEVDMGCAMLGYLCVHADPKVELCYAGDYSICQKMTSHRISWNSHIIADINLLGMTKQWHCPPSA